MFGGGARPQEQVPPFETQPGEAGAADCRSAGDGKLLGLWKTASVMIVLRTNSDSGACTWRPVPLTIEMIIVESVK